MATAAVIKYIPTHTFNAVLARCIQNGWERTFVYEGIDAWIDYGRVDLKKGRQEVRLEWDNWAEGNICGPRELLEELAAAFGLDMTQESNEPSSVESHLCRCLALGPQYGAFDEIAVGIDNTNGRFGEVNIRICRSCHRRWLHYLVEYEGVTGSGRWYSGLLSDADSKVTPESAVSILESLPWHIYGGSYFQTAGRRGSGSLSFDL